jgi:Poxvirus D5 protein-like
MSHTDDIKKLMEIAAKPLKKKEELASKTDSILSPTYDFINACKVKSSKELKVKFSVIFYRYWKWCKNNNIKPEDPGVFAKHLSKKFKKGSYNRQVVYYVDIVGFDITEVAILEADRFLHGVKYGKKKNKKESKS